MNLALFDFDGTITTREMYVDFVRHAIGPKRFALGRVRLAPHYLAYRMRLLSGSSIRAKIVAIGFTGMSETEARNAGESFAQTVLPQVLRPVAMERIAWHKERGDRVVVVSGGLETYLEHWCRTHEVDLLGSRLAVRDGRLTGLYDGEQCVGPEKVRRVRERYPESDYDCIYAYGDTHEDLAMLEMAQHQTYRWQSA
ncbi:MAG: HAD family hydrolase [Lysobacterales bacterium]